MSLLHETIWKENFCYLLFLKDSDLPSYFCPSFSMKLKNNGSADGQVVDVTVYEYFVRHCGIELTYSAYLPCLDVGIPKRPAYFPLEV